jgi:hypothetical protein
MEQIKVGVTKSSKKAFLTIFAKVFEEDDIVVA